MIGLIKFKKVMSRVATRPLLLVLAVAVGFCFFMPFISNAFERTVSSVGQTKYPSTRKTAYYGERYWFFYTNSSGKFVVRSYKDGSFTTEQEIFFGISASAYGSVSQIDNQVYVMAPSNGSDGFMYARRGTLNSADGSITWGDVASTKPTAQIGGKTPAYVPNMVGSVYVYQNSLVIANGAYSSGKTYYG
ncbi:MAG: hypothetical protein KAI33_01505, partial [Elusimicrobiales bacterium]|nr:hypothetical protein [Elusimicrobiales bacterium]